MHVTDIIIAYQLKQIMQGDLVDCTTLIHISEVQITITKLAIGTGQKLVY